MNDATPHTGARRRRRAVAVALAVLGPVLLSGCGGPWPQSAMIPASDLAANLQDLFELIVWLALGVFVLVEGALLFAIIRFRTKRDAHGEPEESPRFLHGNTMLELAWTLAPAVVLVFVAVPTMTTIWEVDRHTEAEDPLVVEVVAHQWWWEFQYPEQSVITANELHVPLGRTVDFRLNSADVIHSFWFPRQGGKRDVVPGRENHLWFTPTEVGRFPGQCGEFCGLSHALMKMEIVVESEEEFEAWVEAQTQPAPILREARVPGEAEVAREIADQDSLRLEEEGAEVERLPGVEPDTAAAQETQEAEAAQESQEAPGADADLAGLAERGTALFMSKGCMACHRIQGTAAQGVLGPDLSHVGSRHTIAAGILENTRENMITWLSAPEAVKPGAKMPNLGLNEEELELLSAYLQSLE